MSDSKLVRWLIATQFTELRTKLGLSQSAMARKIGTAGGETIRKWETGENQPREYSLPGILDAYEADEETIDYVKFLYSQRDSKNIIPNSFEIRPIATAYNHYETILQYSCSFIPGSLQVENYHFNSKIHHKIMSDYYGNEAINKNWERKKSRYKTIINRIDSMSYRAIISESALECLNDMGCEKEQIERLVHASSLGCDIRVIEHPNPYMHASYQLYVSHEESTPIRPSFIYTESVDQSEYIEEHIRFKRMLDIFEVSYKTSQSLEEYLSC